MNATAAIDTRVKNVFRNPPEKDRNSPHAAPGFST